MNDVIPADIILFIAQRIGTVAELEALLILRQYAQVKWSAVDLATRLYISENSADELLRSLCENRLAIQESGKPSLYRYGPASAELETAVHRLAEIYAKHTVPVTNLILSKARHLVEGLRTPSIIERTVR